MDRSPVPVLVASQAASARILVAGLGSMILSDESTGAAPSRGRLTGRRVVVVGAGTRPSADPDAPLGNGRAIALLCAREGASVASVDVDRDAAEHTAALCSREGVRSATIVADVRDADACERLVHEAHECLTGLDGVVANVGFGEGTGLAGTSPELWDDIFALNARSHFLIARAALPMLDDSSAIVFVGSAASLKAGSGLPAYDASKAALFALCRHVALEGTARGIRANVVVPGPVDTPLGRRSRASMTSRAQVRLPLGREATAWDVAYATVFLLSGESSYITAQSLVVDGGITQF